MTDRKRPISWKAIVRGVGIVYGLTFVSGLLLAFNGITPQTDRVAYPLLALLTGAVGVAVALRAAHTTRLTFLLALGLGIWLLNATNVMLDTQSLSGWIDSSAFIGTTLILGRLLLGPNFKPRPASHVPYVRLTP